MNDSFQERLIRIEAALERQYRMLMSLHSQQAKHTLYWAIVGWILGVTVPTLVGGVLLITFPYLLAPDFDQVPNTHQKK